MPVHLTWLKGVALVLAVPVVFILSKLRGKFRHLLTTHLGSVPGPRSDSLLLGNMRRIFKSENSELYEEWRNTYGSTFVYRAFLSSFHLCTFDPRALQYILKTNAIYQKPPPFRNGIGALLRDGILFTEGEQHRRQRRVMNPAFGQAQLRELTDVFLDVSAQLRDAWRAKALESGGSTTVDVLMWLSKASLDIIGRGGFGYDFGALEGKPNELSEAFYKILETATNIRVSQILRGVTGLAKIWPNEGERETQRAQDAMDRVGRELIAEKKRALAAGEKGAGRDLLSLLIQANMDKDLPTNLRMSDEETLGQVPTFLIAGHETTAATMAWCYFQMSQKPDVQERLRAELDSLNTERPTMEELNSLPYLDAVVRETLRLHAVVPNVLRIAVEDDSIPLSNPYLDRNGRTRTEVKIKKGDAVSIPMTAVNRDTALWGPDAREWKPERWLNSPEHPNLPGMIPGITTFLAGPRGCIGYRFAIIEMKALLYYLVRAFKSELAVSADDVGYKTQIVTRPAVKSLNRNELPIILTAV